MTELQEQNRPEWYPCNTVPPRGGALSFADIVSRYGDDEASRSPLFLR
jgi:hypothetical protein